MSVCVCVSAEVAWLQCISVQAGYVAMETDGGMMLEQWEILGSIFIIFCKQLLSA